MLTTKSRAWSKKTVVEIVDELKDIRKTYGRLTPELVVEAARDPNNPLHKHFEWDDARAAEQYRLSQARDLIGKVTINLGTDDKPKNIRAYISVRKDDVQQYVPVTEVRKSRELTAQVLSKAKTDMETWIARYGIFQEFLTQTKMAKQMVKEMSDMLETA